jgi:pyruvate/2-oxoglutarate dehydrogenase complex dihydrolipoamide acyltransferase (E2) component
MGDPAKLARDGKPADQMQGGCFTISSPGGMAASISR